MTPTKDAVLAALKQVKYPGYSRDIVSFGLIKEIAIEGSRVRVALQLTSSDPQASPQIEAACREAVAALPGVAAVEVALRAPAAAAAPSPWAQPSTPPGIRHVVAVASGKGGVGKSTCAANLACALAQQGARVGLLDCDIYGPTIPLMMGVHQRPQVNAHDQLVPLTNHGVSLMSIGFLLEGDTPVIWRGPMIVKTIQQFLGQVAWGELDYLLVDLPPGTGDAQLTLCQSVRLDGGLVVTTPQEASLGVVRKGIAMFQKVNVPILGIVENMSYFLTPQGERVEIFGHGGGREEAQRQGVDFLGEIPIYTEIRIGGDRGVPVVVADPRGAPSQPFLRLAERLKQRIP